MGDFCAGAPLQTVSQDWLRQANTFSLFWRAPVQGIRAMSAPAAPAKLAACAG